jgi:hypothetical protein
MLVDTGASSATNKTIRQSISLPAKVASQVRMLNPMCLSKLIENGFKAEKRKEQEFCELAGKFREAEDLEEAKPRGINCAVWY